MKALPSVSNPRRIILLLILSALILTVVFCSLSFLSFSSQLYIKRSPNTFVGDEKYQTVRQEVEMQLETFRWSFSPSMPPTTGAAGICCVPGFPLLCC